MNKKVGIVATMATLLVFAIGYALFSQKINITGSARAQGDFQITPTCYMGISDGNNANENFESLFALEWSNFHENGAVMPVNGNGASNATCSPDPNYPNRINFSVDLAYPGAAQYFTVKMTNTGSTKAQIDFPNSSTVVASEVCADVNSNGTIANDECVNVLSDIPELDAYMPFVMHDPSGGYYLFGLANNSIAATEQDIASFVDDINNPTKIILDPDESIYVVVMAYFNDYWEGQINNGRVNNGVSRAGYYYTFRKSWDFNFQQYTD